MLDCERLCEASAVFGGRVCSGPRANLHQDTKWYPNIVYRAGSEALVNINTDDVQSIV